VALFQPTIDADAEPAQPRNLSAETLALNAAVIDWGRRRWPGSRVITEFAMGRRRVDIMFVCERDIIAVEVKSKSDKLDRLVDQVEEFQRYIPEVWIAIAPKWQDQMKRQWHQNVLLVDGGSVVNTTESMRAPWRDELVCSRMVELLWCGEAMAIAKRQELLPRTPIPGSITSASIRKMLARCLTGNEIIREVCREFRSRPLCGMGSDKPIGDRNDLRPQEEATPAPPLPLTDRMSEIRRRLQRGDA
jgi:hypothetical protein